jgi:hypothetical protein
LIIAQVLNFLRIFLFCRTIALPHRHAVEWWGLRQCFVSSTFFLILLPTKLQTDLKPFREIIAQITTDFQPLQRYKFLNSLSFFFMILLKIFKPFAINNLSTLQFSFFPLHLSSLKIFKSIKLYQTTLPIASKNELFYSKSSRIPFV